MLTSSVGNTGWFDSTNRMLFHGLLLLVALAILWAGEQGGRPTRTSALRTLVGATAIGALAMLWSPAHGVEGITGALVQSAPAVFAVLLLLAWLIDDLGCNLGEERPVSSGERPAL